ncbi:diguanylate cyclase [Dehalobacterium formicoaceticum]|uniref:Diguanylate cyclase n=1 Tax=Dehalobacterium formicoaceticum TaxID=51515 RepID=A0ABT1Y1D8_9FIRM|nr:HD domain-containing phosphohydrolase [Dehalobacterium formicoaceticum]MCR6544685.1 diguanylate cyclase [Dehalobacterium formicoaceticum]
MEREFYQAVIEDAPMGYACHRLICDDLGRPSDYVFLEVNSAFEELTGLKREKILEHRVTEIIPGIQKTSFDWIACFGEVALGGGNKTLKEYMEPLQKWYHLFISSPEEGTFVTWVQDISGLAQDAADKAVLQTTINGLIIEVDHQYMMQNIIVVPENWGFLSKESLLGGALQDILPDDLFKLFRVAIDGSILSGEREVLRFQAPQPYDGRWFLAEIFPYQTIQGEHRFIISVREITQYQRLAQALAEKSFDLEMFFNVNLDLLCITDLKGNFLKVNASWEELLGYPLQKIEKMNFLDLVHPEDLEATLGTIAQLANQEKVMNFVNRYRCQDGTYKFIEWRSYPYHDLIYAAARDISDWKEREEKITYLSFHDQLTGLYNRMFYVAELHRLDQERNLPISLIMADVNGLKMTNDAFGHQAGDQILIRTAEVLRKVCRQDEIIARIGGDEFVILLPHTSDLDAEKLARRIKDEMRRTKVEIGDLVDQIDLSVSLGWAAKTSPEEDFHQVFKKAERDMYHRKMEESRSMKEKTVQTIVQAFYRRYPKEKKQAEIVGLLCEAMGKKLGFSPVELGELKMAGRYHDLGKIILKGDIVNSPERFSRTEWTEMQRHVEAGYRILSSVTELAQLAKYIFHHHERWDGTGYPNGLKGEEIPLQSRIISIADAYASMTTEQYFRRAMEVGEAYDEIKKNAGSQFDPDLAELFLLLNEIKNGSLRS